MSYHLLGNTNQLVKSCFDLSICNFSYFQVWFYGQDIGSDCTSSGNSLQLTLPKLTLSLKRLMLKS